MFHARLTQALCALLAKRHTTLSMQLRIWAAGLIYGASMAAHNAYATFLGSGLCKIYRQIAGNDVLVAVIVIVGFCLVVAYKFAPSGSVLKNGVGLLTAGFIGFNLEPIIQAAFGVGLGC